MRCGIIFATGARTPRYVQLPEADAVWGASPYVWIQVDPSVWFPSGYRLRKIKRLPGTILDLEHTYQIYFSQDETSSVPNFCVARQFDMYWMGNIVVVKRGRADPCKVLQMGAGDVELTNIVVYSWLKQVANNRLSRNGV